MSKCGLCGGTEIFSGSWSPERCMNCGATEAGDEWYIDEDARPTIEEIKARREHDGTGRSKQNILYENDE